MGPSDKVKSKSLGEYVTVEDAELYAIRMAVSIARALLARTGKRCVEIVTISRRAISAVDKAGHWNTPEVRDIKNQIGLLRDQGASLTLSMPTTDGGSERMECSKAAAVSAAAQQPKAMRSASLSYVKQSIKARWQPAAKINKAIDNGKKSATARYLQLKSGHAVTGVHLLRIKNAQDARCWWCDSSRQTVAHLLMECRKWRRERELMLEDLQHKKIKISRRRDVSDLRLLFGESAMEAVLDFLGRTGVEKRREESEARLMDDWDIDRLDRDNRMDGEESEGEREERAGG